MLLKNSANSSVRSIRHETGWSIWLKVILCAVSTCLDPETYSIPTLIFSSSWCLLRRHTCGHSLSPTTISTICLPVLIISLACQKPSLSLTSLPMLWLKSSSVGGFLYLVCPPLLSQIVDDNSNHTIGTVSCRSSVLNMPGPPSD